MGKKKARKRRGPEPPREGDKPAVANPAGDDGADRNDFGGLPMRDLKKNLGCG